MRFGARTRDLLVSQKTTQRHFFSTLHPLSPVIFATATVVTFVLLRSSKVQLPLLYTACSNAYSEIDPEVTLRPLATSCTKDYKRHSLAQSSFTEPPNNFKGFKAGRVDILSLMCMDSGRWECGQTAGEERW